MHAVREVAAFTAGILLSCGPSQLYGIVKGCIDLAKLNKLQDKIARIGDLQVGQLQRTKYESKYESKLRDLLADGIALIPFAGALLSWRVFSGSWTAPCSGLFEHAIPQALSDHSKLLATTFYRLTGKGDVARRGNQEIPVIDTNGVRMLDAVYTRHSSRTPRPTVVIFHGNENVGPDMSDFHQYYFNRGYDVLSPTMGGYPGSDPVKTCEESSYRDVEGIKNFLQSQGVTQAGYHGVSIGGTLAFQAAAADSAATKLETKFVVADQPFNTAKEVAANVVQNFGYGAVTTFARGAARAAFPEGRKILLSEGVYTETDGLDNVRKAKKLREKDIPLFVIESSDDILMKRHLGGNLADDLLDARYDEEEKASHSYTLEGGHCSLFMDEKSAKEQVNAFVKKAMPIE